jgi:hypothetical protein
MAYDKKKVTKHAIIGGAAAILWGALGARSHSRRTPQSPDSTMDTSTDIRR